MPTAVEQFGQLHTTYNDFYAVKINGVMIDKSNFHNFIISVLKAYENADLANNPTKEKNQRIEDAGNPTIGYGFDLGTYGTWSQVRATLEWAMGGSAGLTAQQLQGLQLIQDWRAAYDANASDAEAKKNIVLGIAGSQSQKNAMASIKLTEIQATNLLEAMVFGDASAGITGDRAYLNNVRTITNNNYGVDDVFPESLELAAMINMRFRGDFTGFSDVFTTYQDTKYSTDGARRAEFWYRILAKSKNVTGGVVGRLQDSAVMFGAFSKEATAQNALEVFAIIP